MQQQLGELCAPRLMISRATNPSTRCRVTDRYNFYEAYPMCKQPVYNQGNCSSSYALIPASVIADRFCAQSKGKIKEKLSV